MNKKLLTLSGTVVLVLAISINIKFSSDANRINKNNKTSLYSIALAEEEGPGPTSNGCYILCCSGSWLWPVCTWKCEILCAIPPGGTNFCWTTGGSGMYCNWAYYSCTEFCTPNLCECGM